MKFTAGLKADGSLWYLEVTEFSPMLNYTAVCALTSLESVPNEFIIVKNKRGWDIPGGHCELNELPIETLKRELREEACADLIKAKVICALQSDYYD